jgi:hypothetical protein
MSEIRRVNQTKRTMPPTLSEQVASVMQTHWRKFLGVIGVPGLYDLVREFGRGKAMEWLYQHLGLLGVWLASYKLAGITVGIVIVILWLMLSIVRETRERESIILDHVGNPYQIRRVSKAWARGTVVVLCALVMLLVYGVYRFYYVSPQALLEKYPLGYVIFDVDKSNAVFPYKTRPLLDKWSIDLSGVSVFEPDKEHIAIMGLTFQQLERMMVFHDVAATIEKKVGHPVTFIQDGRSNLKVKIEILRIGQNGTVFVIGFDYARKN